MDTPEVRPLENPYSHISRDKRKRLTRGLLERAAEATGEQREHILEHVVLVNMGVAKSIASRYRARGVPREDLEQVAYMALVRCVQRFDPDAGSDLMTYLVPSIKGELRRYFRDLGWTVRPPRRVQELQSRVVHERDNLATDNGGGGERAAIAARLGVSESDVEEALSAQGCFTPTSLDAGVGESGEVVVGDMLPCPRAPQESEASEARLMLYPLLRRLPAKDRRLVQRRYFDVRTQQQIAEEFGMSQGQVSRRLSTVLQDLRSKLGGTAAA